MTLLDKVRNRTARVRQHRWRMRTYRSTERHIVVGGSPRSGTTLLRRIIDRHPSLCCGPEMNLYIPFRFQMEALAALSGIPQPELSDLFRSSRSQGAFIDAVAARYRQERGKPRWAEKTPRNVRHFTWILERFPEARLIHIVRDGRDVVCSAAEHPDRRWVDGRWVWEHHPRPLEAYAREWVTDTSAGMRFRGDARYHEMRYEDLVARPADTLRDLCDFIGEPFDERMLMSDDPLGEGGAAGPTAVPSAAGTPAAARGQDRTASPAGGNALDRLPDRGPISTSSTGRWRRDLTGADLEKVLGIAGDRLAELGYGG